MNLDFDSFVLAASTVDLTDEPAARPHADAIEYRMDVAERPLSALEGYDGELPILATNRASWEGGEYEGSDEKRLAQLAEATALEAVCAIDIELESLRAGDADELVESARERDVSIVASAHDFEGMPDEIELLETLSEACEYADVGKFAATAESREDTLALLAVTHRLSTDGKRVATMAMGESGSHTRAVAPVYGSKIGYAPVDIAEATAPGQYDLETLAGLVDTLE